MQRRIILITAVAAVLLGIPACGGGDDQSGASPAAEASAPDTSAAVASPDGRIAFSRYKPTFDDLVSFTINPDGTDLRPLFPDEPSNFARWSPDGTQLQINCCDDGNAAHLIDPVTGRMHVIENPDPDLEMSCGASWSPDGEWLACEGYGVDDKALNGVYLLRLSGGGDFVRLTEDPGGEDIPGDFSPDGESLVFSRADADGHNGLFVVNLDGGEPRELKGGRGLVEMSSGRWSPDGERILVAARRSDDHHKTIWVVDPRTGAVREFPLELPCGGLWSDPHAVGCASPAWSPDGTKIAFTWGSPDGERECIYLANADGTGVVRLTHGTGDDYADWGTPPTA